MFRMKIMSIFLTGVLVSAVSAQPKDAGAIVGETMLNKFFTIVGPVTGKGKSKVAGKDVDYQYTVSNARMEILPGKAIFKADVQVSKPLGYKADVTGDAVVIYDNQKNKIKIELKKATFEMYIKIFGKKVHIDDLDVTEWYRPKFEVDGPAPIMTETDIKLPDGTVKKIYIHDGAKSVTLAQGQIQVLAEVLFSETPPPGYVPPAKKEGGAK